MCQRDPIGIVNQSPVSQSSCPMHLLVKGLLVIGGESLALRNISARQPLAVVSNGTYPWRYTPRGAFQ